VREETRKALLHDDLNLGPYYNSNSKRGMSTFTFTMYVFVSA